MRRRGEVRISPSCQSICIYSPTRSKKLITEFFKPYKAELAQTDNTLKESTILDKISKAKAKGFDAAAMREACNAARSLIPSITDQINSIVSDIYENYEKALNRSNSLDFDDLLLFGVKLFRNHPKAVDWCSHVLIDELYVLVLSSYQYTYDGYYSVRIPISSNTS